MNNYELIIFDLDGTLLDTSPGIFNSVRFSEKQMGFVPIPDERLKQFVGPPPKSMYMKIYGADETSAMMAAKFHRQYGREKAIFEANVYPGIKELLINLRKQGFKTAVSTLKSQGIAESVLKNFELYELFDTVVGMDTAESLTKCDTIKIAMKNTKTTGRTLMVGDSEYDYVGAKEANIDFAGVLYGFGFCHGQEYPFNSIEYPLELIKMV